MQLIFLPGIKLMTLCCQEDTVPLRHIPAPSNCSFICIHIIYFFHFCFIEQIQSGCFSLSFWLKFPLMLLLWRCGSNTFLFLKVIILSLKYTFPGAFIFWMLHTLQVGEAKVWGEPPLSPKHTLVFTWVWGWFSSSSSCLGSTSTLFWPKAGELRVP